MRILWINIENTDNFTFNVHTHFPFSVVTKTKVHYWHQIDLQRKLWCSGVPWNRLLNKKCGQTDNFMMKWVFLLQLWTKQRKSFTPPGFKYGPATSKVSKMVCHATKLDHLPGGMKKHQFYDEQLSVGSWAANSSS